MDHTTTSTLTGGSQMRVRKLMLGTAMVSLFALPAMAQAAEVKLADALNRFASEADVEVLFSSDVGETKITDHVTYSGDAGNDLDSLLEDTGLRFEEPRPGVFIVALLEAPKVPSAQGRLDEAIRTAPVITRADKLSAPDTREAQAQPTSTPAPDLEPAFNLDAPTGVITGQVVDSFSGQPLAGAFVVIEGLGRATSTDTRGFYRIPAAPAGSYSLSVNYIGATFKSQRVTVESGGDVEVNFSLSNSVDDQIVVYGNKSSLQQALNLQRAADNSATVVSSDLMGGFPAETIAEALRRVSGVTFSRDAATGEGDRISVRGFNDQAINIQLNGVDLQGTGIDRGVDLSGFLTDNIKQITIQKSLLPSLEATGSGGLVEIETRSGLDYGEKYLSIGAETEQGFAGGFGDEYQLSATAAYQLTENFGVSGTVQYRDTNSQNYDVSILQTLPNVLPAGSIFLSRVPESFNFPFDPEFSNPLLRGGNYFSRQRDESNLTMSVNAAYDWGNHTRLRFDVQNISADTAFSTSRTTLNSSSRALDLEIPELGGEVRRRTLIGGIAPTLGLVDSEENLETTTISFRGETDLNDWEFDYKIGFSRSEKQRLNDSLSFSGPSSIDVASLFNPSADTFFTRAGDTRTYLTDGAVNLTSNGVPLLALSDVGNARISDAANYSATVATRADAVDRSDAFVLEFDARKYFNKTAIEYIELGGKFDDRERDNSDDALSTTNVNAFQSYIRRSGLQLSLSELGASQFNVSNLSNIGVSQSNVPFLSAGSASDMIDIIANNVVDDPSTPENEARYTFTNRDADPITQSGAIAPAKITESIYAGWLQTKAVVGDFDLVGGVRYQREERQGRLLSAPVIRVANGFGGFEPRETFVSAGLVTFTGTETRQETWTPSLIANYRPSDEVVVRGTYFRSTIHPSIDKIARPTSIVLDVVPGQENGQIREANPDLNPSKSDNFELDLSYFFKDNPGLIRLGLFYKKISNNFTQTIQLTGDGGESVRQRILDELSALGAIDPNLLNLPEGGTYTVQRPVNGEGGNIYGFEAELIREIDFLPESMPSFIENFSVLGNITYTKSDFEEFEQARNDDGDIITINLERPLKRQSEWSGNASLRYDDGPFSGSVIYTYQSLSATDFDEFNLNNIIPSFDTLDMRLSYTLEGEGKRPRIIFFAEGDDLLTGAHEADLRSGVGSALGDGDADYFFPTQLQFNGGRRFTVGARMTF